MKVYRDPVAPTEYGKGTNVVLDGNELAHAILVYLYSQGVVIDGCRTVTVWTEDSEHGLCGGARVYVDPSDRVIYCEEEVL